MHGRFGLTLMVTHACNLRCTYCYTGEKLRRAMPFETGRRAIDRAIASLTPAGTLELGFFGGEPLIEAALIRRLIGYACSAAVRHGVRVEVGLTTNGTIDTDVAWSVMMLPHVRVAISHDGLPDTHDRHRRTAGGAETSSRVLRAIERLLQAGKEFRAVLVVRPDHVSQLPDGLEFLFGRGVRQFDPSLDLWTTWNRRDGEALAAAIARSAGFWAEHLPECGVSWFDDQAARIAAVPVSDTARCGFGFHEIAVAPSGNLYPCERLIGADLASNPMRLPGNALDGDDFLGFARAAEKSAAECSACPLNALCATSCRCSNFVRTGDVARPDRLLCLWDQACHRETIRALRARTLTCCEG